MRKAAKIALPVLLLGALCFHIYSPPAILRQSPPQDLERAGRHAHLVRWCDAQGFPDLRDATIVSFYPKDLPWFCGSGMKRSVTAEFLLKSRPTKWIVFSPNSPWAFSGGNEPPGLLEYPRWEWTLSTTYAGVRGDELANYAELVIQALEHHGNPADAPVAIPQGLRLHAVVVARAALRRGNAGVATRILEAVEAHTRREGATRPLTELLDLELFEPLLAPQAVAGLLQSGSSLEDADRRLREVRRRLGARAPIAEWQARMAGAALVLVESAYQSSGEASDRLLRVAQSWSSEYPHDTELADAIKVLRRMREDARQPPVGASSIAIRALRTTDPNRWFRDSKEAVPAENPRGFLRRQGYDAVPALLEALQDESLSRIAEPEPRLARSSRVRDLALSIIEEIAQQKFAPVDPQSLGARKKETAYEAARVWWRTKGEPASAAIFAQVEAGGRKTPEAFEELLRKRPAQVEALFPSVIDGCFSADEKRRVLVALGRSHVASEMPLLRNAVHSCRDLESRVLVAGRLASVGGREEAKVALLHDVAVAIAGASADGPNARTLALLFGTLMLAGEAEGIEQLSALLPKIPFPDRIELFKVLGGELPFVVRLLTDIRPNQRASFPPTVVAVAEKALGNALHDTTTLPQKHIIAEWPPERASTAAARALAQLLPEHYRLRVSVIPAEVVAWEDHIKAVWVARQRHTAPPAEHEPPVPKPVDVSGIASLLEQYIAQPENRDATRAELVSRHGLSALPLAQERLSAADSRTEARKALEALVFDLSWTVREILLPDDPLPPELDTAFRALRGQPLTAAALQPVLAAAYRSIPATRTGFAMDAAGASDAWGCTVRFRWSTTPIKFPPGMWGWHVTPGPARPKGPHPVRPNDEVQEPAFARDVAEAIVAGRGAAKHSEHMIVFYTHRGQ